AQGCASDHQRGAYKRYMANIGSVGSGSAQIGSRLAQLLETPGLKQADLITQLNGLIQEQEQDVFQAQKLHPPGPINAAHQRAIDALGLRVGGMKGLAGVFTSTAKTSDSIQAGATPEHKAGTLVSRAT